jgi:hypothetical protein
VLAEASDEPVEPSALPPLEDDAVDAADAVVVEVVVLDVGVVVVLVVDDEVVVVVVDDVVDPEAVVNSMVTLCPVMDSLSVVSVAVKLTDSGVESVTLNVASPA